MRCSEWITGATEQIFITHGHTTYGYAKNQMRMICIFYSFPGRAPAFLSRRRNGPWAAPSSDEIAAYEVCKSTAGEWAGKLAGFWTSVFERALPPLFRRLYCAVSRYVSCCPSVECVGLITCTQIYIQMRAIERSRLMKTDRKIER